MCDFSRRYGFLVYIRTNHIVAKMITWKTCFYCRIQLTSKGIFDTKVYFYLSLIRLAIIKSNDDGIDDGYNPWGKDGAGAPIHDKDGKTITQVSGKYATDEMVCCRFDGVIFNDSYLAYIILKLFFFFFFLIFRLCHPMKNIKLKLEENIWKHFVCDLLFMISVKTYWKYFCRCKALPKTLSKLP